jgi:hypothetical protein
MQAPAAADVAASKAAYTGSLRPHTLVVYIWRAMEGTAAAHVAAAKGAVQAGRKRARQLLY